MANNQSKEQQRRFPPGACASCGRYKITNEEHIAGEKAFFLPENDRHFVGQGSEELKKIISESEVKITKHDPTHSEPNTRSCGGFTRAQGIKVREIISAEAQADKKAAELREWLGLNTMSYCVNENAESRLKKIALREEIADLKNQLRKAQYDAERFVGADDAIAKLKTGRELLVKENQKLKTENEKLKKENWDEYNVSAKKFSKLAAMVRSVDKKPEVCPRMDEDARDVIRELVDKYFSAEASDCSSESTYYVYDYMSVWGECPCLSLGGACQKVEA
jgi:hypothetical protein